MRPTQYLAAAVLMLPLAVLAQEAPEAAPKKQVTPESVSLHDPFVLKTEMPPQPNPTRLVLNLTNREFVQDFERRQAAAIVGGTSPTTTTLVAPPAAPAGAPSAPQVIGEGGALTLAQPNLPVAAQGATPTAATAQAASAPNADGTPPPPLPQTMAQAAQQQAVAPGAAEPAASATPAGSVLDRVAPPAEGDDEAPQSDLKARVLAFVKAQQKNLMFGGIVFVSLIALLTMRRKRRAESDDTDE